ncbi:MAG TPA: DUF5132 domain-containing protein [Stellaceae bacterium]|nr:DUF5132 domain-containing protein [Stellaceae bacterium]
MAAMLAGGAVGIFLAPIVTPALARMMRPAARAALKAGLAVYRRGQEVAAELQETIEDVTAELQAASVEVPPTAATYAAAAAETPAAERPAVH